MSSLQLSHLLRAFSTAQGVTARKVVRSYLAVVPALRRQACGARCGTSCPPVGSGTGSSGLPWSTGWSPTDISTISLASWFGSRGRRPMQHRPLSEARPRRVSGSPRPPAEYANRWRKLFAPQPRRFPRPSGPRRPYPTTRAGPRRLSARKGPTAPSQPLDHTLGNLLS